MDLISQSSSLFGSLKNAVLGNPVTREFTIGRQVGSFGPGLLWKIFEGKKKTTGQGVSVFIFEKSLIDRYGRRDKEEILEKMRNGPQRLTKLRHPRILTVQHPLEESRDSLAFATEPVFSSLSNAFGKHENFAAEIPGHLKDFDLYSVEKVYGLLQIAEGLAFLHNDANLCEGNITPDTIVITKEGQWKIAGLHFSCSKLNPTHRNEYSTQLPPAARQNLNYLAPEYIFTQAGVIDFDLGKADMFSFGCLISAVYNQLKTPFDASDNISSYKKCCEQLSRLGSDYLKNVPVAIRDHVSLLLNASGQARPDANSTITHTFFDDVAAMTLKYLDSLVQRDDVTKSQFFKNLHHVLDKLPLRVLQQRILPPLFSEFPNHMMIPFVLPNVFLIAEKSPKDDYMRLVFPELKQIFNIEKPVQVLLIFMQKMEFMLKMTDQSDIKNFVLPLVFKALEAPSEEIQELVLTIIPNFVHMIDYSSLKNSIISRIKVLITKYKSLRVGVSALVCLGKIIDHLDKFLLVDEIFPIFKQIPSKEPAILMAILGIYKQTLRNSKVYLEKDYLATEALPFLLPLSVEPTLNVQQFNNFMSVIREMFDRVEQEHRTKLEQLQKMQDEQRSSIDFVKASNNTIRTEETSNIMSKVDDLIIGSSDETKIKKTVGADSEFAKVFGLSVKSKNASSGISLLGETSVQHSNSNRIDIPFTQHQYGSNVKCSEKANPKQNRVDSQLFSASKRTPQQPSDPDRQITQSAMFDSMMNSQLNSMKIQQQQTFNPVFHQNPKQFETANLTTTTDGTRMNSSQMFRSQQSTQQSFFTVQSNLVNENSRTNNLNIFSMQPIRSPNEILQPSNSSYSSTMSSPINSSQTKSSLSSKDIDDLLL